MCTSLENDMVCLLESLHCLNEDKTQQIQALEHLAEMCLQDQGDVIFNKINGLSVVAKIPFVKKSVSTAVVQKALITLGNAALQSVENKNILCTDHILGIIYSKMLNRDQDKKMIASVAYFLSCLSSNSEKAQNKIRKSKCLEKFVLLYRYYHPKGNSDRNLLEDWFDKAASNSPIMLNHISHALKAMMNKPRNGENQIACSRLLNLALSTLSISTWCVKAKIEALQFIADCLYENGKTLNIFHMIGGVRLLSELLAKELVDLPKNGEEKLIYLNAILDTISVLAGHGLDDAIQTATVSFIDSLLICCRRVELDSLHVKSLMCLSELVHENERCQKKLVSSNGIGDIINIMSKKQDDITSKIGTSILQSCIKTMSSPDDCEIEVTDEQGKRNTVESRKNTGQSDKLKNILNTIKNMDGSVDLQNILKIMEDEKALVDSEEKIKKLNIRRGVRRKNDAKNSNKSSNNNKNLQENSVIIEMLKNQREMIEDFQNEISCLRAEIGSQPSSNYGDSVRSISLLKSTPHKRSHPKLCPNSEPRRRQAANLATPYTPQPSHRKICADDSLYSEGNASYNQRLFKRQRTHQALYQEKNSNVHDDDERPALVEPPEQSVQSVYEKVTNWQKEALSEKHKIDHDGFQIPFVPSQSRATIRPTFPRPSLIPRPVKHSQYKTPTTEKLNVGNQHLQNAPKKTDRTVRRRPLSLDERFTEESETPTKLQREDQTKRSLNFERFELDGVETNTNEIQPTRQRKTYSKRCSLSSGFHEQSSNFDSDTTTITNAVLESPPQVQKDQMLTDVCLGCKPSIRHINSRNFFNVLENNPKTCDIHLKLCDKIKESRGLKTLKIKNIYRTPPRKKFILPARRLDTKTTPKRFLVGNVELPKKKLKYGNPDDVETMSVFSFRSQNTLLKEKDKESVYSMNTCYTDASSIRRQRQDYSEEEINYIKHGIERYGRRWRLILHAYPFKEGRLPKDLSDKYKNLKKLKEGDSQNKIKIPVPFTTEELVNLKRGVCEHGEDWEAILDRYSFDATRTPLQLKVKWETVVSQQ